MLVTSSPASLTDGVVDAVGTVDEVERGGSSLRRRTFVGCGMLVR